MRRTLFIGVILLGIVLACVGSIALWGRALSESDVAVGTLVPQEVLRARMAEAHARFVAMTPAEHLAEARLQMGGGMDAGRDRMGNVHAALDHLDAIQATAPEFAEATMLRTQIQQRRLRFARMLATVLGQRLREFGDTSALDEARKRSMRVAFAATLNEPMPRGISSVRVEDDTTSLRFDRRRCNQAVLEAIVSDENRAGLQAIGFRRACCANDAGVMVW